MSKLSNCEQIEKVEGNKQPPLSFQCKNWIMTYNNYPKDIFEQIEQVLAPLCEKYVFGKEVGEEGTPHIQGAFCLKSKMRQGTLYKLFDDKFYLNKMKGKWTNQKYCIKDGDYISNVKWKKPCKILKESELFKWELEILKILKEDPDDRSIYWFHDDDKCGTGKTTFCKYLIIKYGAIVLGGKSADMKNGIVDYMKNNDGREPELILVNLPRTFDINYLSYTGIEECKDMMFYSGKYEGGMVCGNCPHLFIFSNEKPDRDAVDPKRWKIFNILKNEYEL